MKKNQTISFEKFLTIFPTIDLPITLTEADHIEYSRHNKPIPGPMIAEFLASVDDDELTEYVACFQIPQTKGFHAIVYWKAGLMQYQYQMATYDPNGQLLDKHLLAAVKSDGQTIVRSVATIESDWLINIVEGSEAIQDKQSIFNPQTSQVHNLELTHNGEILIVQDEE